MMLAKMFSKEWLWIAVGSAALLMIAVSTAAAQSNVPVQFAVQTGSATAPVRTADYSSDDQARASVQPVWWRGYGWGRPYRAYYYGAPYAYSYYPAPYVSYYSAAPSYAYYSAAPYYSYYPAPYTTYYAPRAYYYGPRWYGRW